MAKLKDLPIARGRLRSVGQDPHLIKSPRGKSLSESHSALAEEWDEERNYYKASEVSAGSDRQVWWKCGRCHQRVLGQISRRARAWDEGTKNRCCYFCAGKGFGPQTQAELIPNWLAQEAVHEQHKVPARSLSLKAVAFRLWKCPDKNCGHIYSSRVCDRIDADSHKEKQGCPAAVHSQDGVDLGRCPDLGAEFVKSRRNRGFDPSRIPADCKVLWKGKSCGHFFSATFETVYRKGCPTCAKKQKEAQFLVGSTRLTREFVRVPGFPDLCPANISIGSNHVAVWRGACGHTFHLAVFRRTDCHNPQDCKICSRKGSDRERFFSKYPRLLRFWDYQKNTAVDKGIDEPRQIEPDNILCDDRKKYWFLCKRQGHSYQASPLALLEIESPCPSCKTLPNSLATVRSDLVDQWCEQLNEDRTPWNMAAGSDQKVFWKCHVHASHVWEAKIKKRVNEDTGCPFCANRQVSVTNSLAGLYAHLTKYFDAEKNHAKKPEEIIAATKQPLWWVCSCGQSYARIIRNMVEYGPGCPNCKMSQRRLAHSGAKKRAKVLI